MTTYTIEFAGETRQSTAHCPVCALQKLTARLYPSFDNHNWDFIQDQHFPTDYECFYDGRQITTASIDRKLYR